MMPKTFVVMEKFPLTTTGKIDRNALPEPEAQTRERIYVAPETETEIKLAEIWTEELFGKAVPGTAETEDASKVGREDNFFDLGGHSLKAVNLIGKVHRAFNVKLTFRIGDG